MRRYIRRPLLVGGIVLGLFALAASWLLPIGDWAKAHETQATNSPIKHVISHFFVFEDDQSSSPSLWADPNAPNMYKGPIVGTNLSAENASTVGTIISPDDSADPGD